MPVRKALLKGASLSTTVAQWLCHCAAELTDAGSILALGAAFLMEAKRVNAHVSRLLWMLRTPSGQNYIGALR